MRETVRAELEQEFARRRAENERVEAGRRREIAEGYPEIEALIRKREQLVFGTIRKILSRRAEEEDLPERMRELSQEIRRKLVESGLPENYLEPVCRCARCGDTGYVGEPVREMCGCMKEAMQALVRKENGLAVNERESFETFDASILSEEPLPGDRISQKQLMLIIRKRCEDWANTYPAGRIRNLLLTGPSGLGKTFLMRSIARRLGERGIDVLLLSAYRMFQMARSAYMTNDEEPEALVSPEVLMIDDLGSEPLMQNVTVEQLFLVVNRRMELGKATVMSTNLQLNEFKQRYTERVASRMTDAVHSCVLTLKGPDLRDRERQA